MSPRFLKILAAQTTSKQDTEIQQFNSPKHISNYTKVVYLHGNSVTAQRMASDISWLSYMPSRKLTLRRRPEGGYIRLYNGRGTSADNTKSLFIHRKPVSNMHMSPATFVVDNNRHRATCHKGFDRMSTNNNSDAKKRHAKLNSFIEKLQPRISLSLAEVVAAETSRRANCCGHSGPLWTNDTTLGPTSNAMRF